MEKKIENEDVLDLFGGEKRNFHNFNQDATKQVNI